MTILPLKTHTGIMWQLFCRCGYQTQPAHTIEDAGRQMDLHQARQFPIGTERRECELVTPHPRALLGRMVRLEDGALVRHHPGCDCRYCQSQSQE